MIWSSIVAPAQHCHLWVQTMSAAGNGMLVMRFRAKILGATLAIAIAPLGAAAQLAGPETGYADDLEAERCYVTFFRYWGGRGHALTRFGPEEIRDVEDLYYRPGRDLDGRILSVATGPDTWIELYDHSRFRQSLYRIGPGQAVNLKSKVVDSYRIYCQPPNYW